MVDTFGIAFDILYLCYLGPPVVPGGTDETVPAPGERLCEMRWMSQFLAMTLDQGPRGNSFAACSIMIKFLEIGCIWEVIS